MFLLSFLSYYNSLFNKDYSSLTENFQKDFHQQEDLLDSFLKSKSKIFLQKDVKDSEFNFHVYRNDSLIFWNTNTLPLLRFADLHFPANGIVKLQNGWYYAKTKKLGNVVWVASFLIKKEYSYQNDYLKNEFNPIFNLPFQAAIILEKENAYPIYTKNKEFAFAIFPLENQEISDFDSNFLVLLFLFFIGFLLQGIFHFLKHGNKILFFTLATVLLVTHYFFLRFDFYSFLNHTRFFDPALYANSNWFPNLFMFCLNCIFILFFTSVLAFLFKKSKNSLRTKIVSFVVFLLSFFFAYLIGTLYHSLVKDSSIPLEIDKLFQLNFYSFIAALCIGILFFSYFILIRAVFLSLLNQGISKVKLSLLYLVSSLFYFVLDFFFGSNFIFLASWPLVMNGIILLNVLRAKGKLNFNYGVVLLFVFSAFISIVINNFYDKKEKSERELFASQLASDQDISAELEFLSLNKKICEDNYFQKIISTPRILGVSEFKDFMERKFYHHFWEHYEFDFYLFENEKSIINHSNNETSSIAYLETILQKHSKVSEICPLVFYIKDYTSQLSYITKQVIYNQDSTKSLLLYSTLKSKRIPEKIGFPRLLISDHSSVFKPIENYSIAKYYRGTLVSQNGKFSYPTKDFALTTNIRKASGYYDNENYNHYLLRKNSRDLIVLSKKLPSNFQLLTSFSYLFCFFGLFLLLILSIQNFKTLEFSNLTLAFKIQIILIAIVFISLLTFGFGSGKFVSNQYNEYSTDLIKEKIKSVQVEVKNKLGEERTLSIEAEGDFMESNLKKFAQIFVTDINLYDRKGYILASSRPKIFNAGLVSEQINPLAFEQLEKNKKSEFIHQENIGNLTYLSAYVPLFNNDGKFLAYINLQYFGQQQGFESQIENFLVAIINVFILLLAFSIILSILVSNWLISPLKTLKNSLSKIQLGKYNEPILYESKDEIGALVRNYNQKLEELAFTAQQLAQSERESAWREMAKQVAHEIKNPLTPMKLSLQHLQRIYDPNDPNSKVKLDKVINSIIEQIDALTKIANEFSSFAKMPQENKSNIDILPIIEHAIVVFSQENDVEITFKNKAEKTLIFGDKDLILRVFNNLIKNAIQAIHENKKGFISISLEQKQNKLLIKIEDNGRGIPESMHSKIFMPNFTTKSTGTGLGLAMVKQIVTLHEGEIWFESEENKTVFFIELPLLN